MTKQVATTENGERKEYKRQRKFGSVRQYRGHGLYYASYQHPYKLRDEHGNIIRCTPRTGGFHTIEAADDWLRKESARIEMGVWKSKEEEDAEAEEVERQRTRDTYTFGEYGKTWFANRSLAASTRNSYQFTYNKWIEPKWGKVPITNITTKDIRTWLATDGEVPEVARTRRNMFNLFATIMRTAYQDEVIETLPIRPKMLGSMKGARSGKSQRHAPRALEPWEVAALAGEMPGDMWPLVVRFAAGTGLRLGELRGLKRGAINLKTRKVMINGAVTGEGKYATETTPKTEAGNRTLTIPSDLFDELTAYLAKTTRGKDAYVFPAPSNPNKPFPPSTFRGNIGNAVKRAQIEGLSPHDFRHTFASLAATVSGVSAQDVSTAMGHENSSITRRYIHANDERRRLITDHVAEALAKTERPKEEEGEVITLRPTGTEQ
ncbi:tyrosine-type recombinase/integrase [Actinomyces culturomici]|uniref:tyrosine-type recombinase/integrase n=1 Tax=Actinomyces culturomici TaxID=1926276 RepID=UPI000E2031EB|nr:site-specific integrase [Actinomyces culturomici]